MRNAKSRRGNQIKMLASAAGAAIGMMGFAAAAQAATSYNDAASTRFNLNTTWSPNGVPVSGDTATIDTHTVTTSNVVGEVPAGVAVTISGTGKLSLGGNTSSINAIDPLATVKIDAGGTLAVNSNNTMTAALALSGGKILFNTQGPCVVKGAVDIDDSSVIEIPNTGKPVFNPTATGSGKITVNSTSGSINSSTVFGMTSTSDWDGDLDLNQSGAFRGSATSTMAQTFPGDVRLGPSAGIYAYAYTDLTTWTGFQGILSGSGTLGGYQSQNWAIGGTGNLSPGDGTGGTGTFKVSANAFASAAATGNFNATMSFVSGSKYTVDITGAATYDVLSVSGQGTGVGNITINDGAKLIVNLWTPSSNTTLDAIIIDASAASATGSPFTGGTSSITWNNSAGWTNLATSWVGPDLHVTGTYVPEPTSAASLLAAGALMAIRRRRRN